MSNKEQYLKRREVLKRASVVAAVTTLAGCSIPGGDGGDNGGGGGDNGGGGGDNGGGGGGYEIDGPSGSGGVDALPDR